jgi:NADPH-dependent 2,4-dienoyl-CoA reductase/sulfur reductase-like enzyme
VIKSATTEIDRQNKTIKLKNGLSLPYDYLVLTPGIQFDVKTLSSKLGGLKSVYGINRGNEEYIDTAIKLFVASCQSAGEDADGSFKPSVIV